MRDLSFMDTLVKSPAQQGIKRGKGPPIHHQKYPDITFAAPIV
jgi:hypothetical protein